MCGNLISNSQSKLSSGMKGNCENKAYPTTTYITILNNFVLTMVQNITKQKNYSQRIMFTVVKYRKTISKFSSGFMRSKKVNRSYTFKVSILMQASHPFYLICSRSSVYDDRVVICIYIIIIIHEFLKEKRVAAATQMMYTLVL